MGTPFFHEFKKQASFYLKEKIRTARLALTDVTPAQLLTEEATDGNPGGPDARTMRLISRAAFEVDDYWRIVEVLHKRFSTFDKNHWRESYKALILLEHLLTHGPESTASEFRCDEEVIRELGKFQHVDERGFNWGLNVRKKSERVLHLLENGQLLKEERSRARNVSRGIEGFGSFCQRSSSSSIRESCLDRSNSHYNDYGWNDNEFSSIVKNLAEEDKFQTNQKFSSSYRDNQTEDSDTWVGSSRVHICRNMETECQSFKERENEQDIVCELEPLLVTEEDKPRINLP